MAFETIRREREKLLVFLDRAPDLILDDAASQGFISETEYNDLDKLQSSKEKMRKLLVKIQRKGEETCQQFLEGVRSLFPDLPPALWPPASTCSPSGCSDQKCNPPPAEAASEKNEPENPDLVVSFPLNGSKSSEACSPTGCSDQNCNPPPAEAASEKNEPENPDLVASFPLNGNKNSERTVKSFLRKLGLSKQSRRKLTMGEILEIDSESLKTMVPQTLEDLPWHFLRKLMALNGTARNTSLVSKVEEALDQGDNKEDELFTLSEMNTGVSVNPLDVLCAILLSSDSFLQQEILLKMSMCQFALPLILPPLETPKCTFMLWAMRDIVRKWRPHSLAESRSFREENVVLISMPTISFVRMGTCTLSKSKLLNEVLSSPQHHHDFFVHRDVDCGNVAREISNGLVEVSWYFPGGRENSALFPEPVAITNLRGDIESHWMQFSLLTEVSSAVFIFVENISESEYNMLSTLQKLASKCYFVLNTEGGKSKEALGFLNKLAPVLNLNRSQLLMKEKKQNITEFVKKLRSAMSNIVCSHQKVVNMEEMASVSRELGIEIDEDAHDCQNGTLHAKEIVEEIEDVANYKKEMLKLQGDLWRNVAKVEKELCRMKGQADIPTEDYKSQLREKRIQLRIQQNQCDLTNGITKFINGIQHLCPVEKHFFLKWMKFRLDHVARANLLRLREEYKEKCRTTRDNTWQLKQLDELISISSLGVEHFMRELGQFYEAEYMMVNEGKMSQSQRQFVQLPRIAADLMLEGFPIELIDGDASNIPLQWVTDVLNELHVKLGGKSRMQVLTVLGVQSTGKSTLLNTMFGLQFAVSSGRCTRGAFMTLLRVTENLQQEIGCDFVLVIDTEGLKAPELAKLEDSYEHDNELATLVIGLSDITIVNLAMENATEMKDILQIVVHAFLRMEDIGHKPKCQFVHQNVSDVSAHDQNMRDRKHLLEQLNEMTKAAARMEKQYREVSFSDIMDYDPEKDNWYIPGLWHGVPPMAPVNLGYSESVSELKRYLFDFMRISSQNRFSKDIPHFVEWVKSLWNAVKHENFIFSFRNSLVADAYNQLSVKYSEWEWDFRKEIYLWVSKADTSIQNHSLEELEADVLDKLKLEASHRLDAGEQKLLQCIQSYFESGGESLPLIEKYKEDFIRSAKLLRNHLENYSVTKCQETILIRKGQGKIDNLQAKYLSIIERKVKKLLEECKERECNLNSEELKWEFEKTWKEILEELPATTLTHRKIHAEVFYQLRKDLESRGSLANQIFQELINSSGHSGTHFIMKREYIEMSIVRRVKGIFKDYLGELEIATMSLTEMCRNYVSKKVSLKGDYDETYCRELLRIINQELQEKDFQRLHITICFVVDVKYHILKEAADCFQKMHDAFYRANNLHQRLENLKHNYFSIFQDLYYEKDACQKRARDFCDVCLKPALVEYLNKRLGIDIVDDFLSSGQSIHYGSRSFFQFTVQKKLLEDENFGDYVKYINQYEQFVKFWIEANLLDHFGQRQDLAVLEREILSAVIKKIKEAVESCAKETVTLPEFLECFCHEMSEELVISKDSLDVILFNNTAKVGPFSADVLDFISEVMEIILAEQFEMNVDTILQNISFKPQDEIFKRVFGCGKQCPFCKVPCEAGGGSHQEHFASVHRPQGLGRYRCADTEKLVYSLCSSDVTSNGNFRNWDTNQQWHPYKEYRQYYPDWRIQPDVSITASDYWKFVFNKYNQQFAKEYKALPADLPEDWKRITKQQALGSIQEAFNMNE
ncbi:interferon-induced very large GTPase 1-like isoform X2 [Sceloporus undulatus]|uniref:interferon-induced very large GTPase 1-like isoform X2 n=1 Tax=Sceloporus undulatus TaxID=8520 RepID=UPI001C4AA5E7|nr:interferon-induced very large GTPase 1-like isoform X2 [Sceloporus undulatus]